MPKSDKYVPKHRAPSAAAIAQQAPKRVLRSTVVLTGLAVAATGGVVSAGVVAAPSVSQAASDLRSANPLDRADLARADLEERGAAVSRSDRREATDPAKEAALTQTAEAAEGAVTRTEDLSDEDPRDIARALLPEFGFSADQFGCLDSLYVSESGWRWNADNPTSSAYGIPQALPGSKMASAGADWETNPVTQIRWGLGYIADRYGSPCSAWGFKQGHGWY